MTRRQGQFITGLIAMILLILLFCILSETKAKAQCTNLDIVLVADYSSSVKGNEGFVYQAITTFAEELTLPQVNDVRLGVIMFAEEADVVCKPDNDYRKNLPNVSSYEGISAAGPTNIELALQTATVELLKAQDGRRKLIILISDGDATIGSCEQALVTGQQIQALGIGICAVLIKDASSRPEFMKQISSGCYAETNYENLLQELKKLNLCL